MNISTIPPYKIFTGCLLALLSSATWAEELCAKTASAHIGRGRPAAYASCEKIFRNVAANTPQHFILTVGAVTRDGPSVRIYGDGDAGAQVETCVKLPQSLVWLAKDCTKERYQDGTDIDAMCKSQQSTCDIRVKAKVTLTELRRLRNSDDLVDEDQTKYFAYVSLDNLDN